MFSGVAWSRYTSLLPKHQDLGIFLHMPPVQEVFMKLPKARFGRYTFGLAAVSPRLALELHYPSTLLCTAC